ncbi:MAG: 3-deoxy-D-manno-octulosonic acid transferase [Gammaproteobacteria bacterium]|nr:3-deoxy-D-manno-octulosonic acid transferase [Gammaproteobacteria bacterium]
MLIYRLLLGLLSPLLLSYLIIQSLRQGGWRQLRQRLGFTPHNRQPTLWFHAASVGELHALLPLLERLQQQQPTLPLQLTTTTFSAATIAGNRLASLNHSYLPFDFGFAVTRGIARLQPRLLVMMETEIWPNLFHYAKKQGVAIIIINARLSPKTANVPRWLRHLYRQSLQQLNALYARSEADHAAYIQLGANPNHCSTVGNIKFAAPHRAQQPARSLTADRPYLLAASTRDHEEPIIVAAWQQLPAALRPLLVIAPRHPQRLNAILQRLPKELKIAVRSRQQTITPTTELYLADTFGELYHLFSHALVTIIGGSFVAKGGHNLLEPAALGKAVVIGPHYENFYQEVTALANADAIKIVKDATALRATLLQLLTHPEERHALEVRAANTVAQLATVLDDYQQIILRHWRQAAPAAD